jgi:hypothetical protein
MKAFVAKLFQGAVVTGRSLAHLDLDARQRACLAVEISTGGIQYQPTVCEAIRLAGANAPYHEVAKALSRVERLMVLAGQRPNLSFAALLRAKTALPAPAAPPPLPASVATAAQTLVEIAKVLGPDQLLNAAVQAERDSRGRGNGHSTQET